MMSGLAIGLFIAFIVYLDKQPENSSNFGDAVQKELDQLKQNKQASKTNKPADEPEESETQKFNFYTLLPKLEVFIPESETTPPESRPQKDRFDPEKRYMLQVGSFQNLPDAEKHKANIAFLGLSADIQNVTIDGQRWHRVRTGPYTDRKELFNSKQILSSNGINAIAVELK